MNLVDKKIGQVLLTYPSHVKVQLLSTEANKNDYFSMKINNITQYVRSIYFRTINFDEIIEIWKDDNDNIVRLKKDSTFFTKIIEMQYKELFDRELDLTRYQIEEERDSKEQEAEKELEI